MYLQSKLFNLNSLICFEIPFTFSMSLLINFIVHCLQCIKRMVQPKSPPPPPFYSLYDYYRDWAVNPITYSNRHLITSAYFIFNDKDYDYIRGHPFGRQYLDKYSSIHAELYLALRQRNRRAFTRHSVMILLMFASYGYGLFTPIISVWNGAPWNDADYQFPYNLGTPPHIVELSHSFTLLYMTFIYFSSSREFI